MKIGFKHFATYAPYNVQLLSRIESKIETMPFEKCKLKSFNMQSNCLTIIHEVKNYSDGKYVTDKEYSDVKLVLRKLHRIADLITLPDGREFVPLEAINEIIPDFDSNQAPSELEDLLIVASRVEYEEYKFSNVQEVINLLLECHFDIFGLIDAGLAIDIDSL